MSIEFYTLILSLLIYFLLYLFPGFVALGQGYSSISGSVYDVPRLFPLAFNYAVGYIIVFLLSFFALTKIIGLKYWWQKENSKAKLSLRSDLIVLRFDKRVKKIAFLCLSVAVILSLIFLDFNQLINPSYRHFSQHNHIQNLIQFLLLIAICLFLFANYSYKFNKFILLFVSLCLYLLYPLAISSRSMAIPFIPVSLYFFFNKRNLRNKILSLISLYIGILFYITSLRARSEGFGLIKSLNTFFGFLMYPNFTLFYKIIDMVSPGISTTSLALKMFESSEYYGLFSFLRYVSPLPSFIFPVLGNSILESPYKLSFSPYLGATAIGLNTDIISEWIFWFGSWGYLAGGFFLAVLNALPIFLRKKQILTLKFLRILFLMSTLLYISAGSAMSVRAASRLYAYVLLITLISYLVQKRNTRRTYYKIASKKNNF